MWVLFLLKRYGRLNMYELAINYMESLFDKCKQISR